MSLLPQPLWRGREHPIALRLEDDLGTIDSPQSLPISILSFLLPYSLWRNNQSIISNRFFFFPPPPSPLLKQKCVKRQELSLEEL